MHPLSQEDEDEDETNDELVVVSSVSNRFYRANIVAISLALLCTGISGVAIGEQIVTSSECEPCASYEPQLQPQKHVGSKFTLERLLATRAAALELRKSLESYYGEHNHMMLDAWYTDPSVDNKRSDKMVDTFARALVDDDQRTFIIGTIGSSVAAGHDNCNYDSYEKQLERTWASVWKASGTHIKVQNAGEGGKCGDSHENQIFCVNQNVVPWVDIIHYSWSYFERSTAYIQHEMLGRWARFMSHQPPVHFFFTGGANNNCYTSNEHKRVFEAHAKDGMNALCLEKGLKSGGKYNGKVWGHVGDGHHNTTRYGELEESPERKNSLGVVFRNWHPGPLGFQLVSDSFAYVYTGYILSALDLIEREFKAGRDPRDKWKTKRLPALKSDFDPPLYCDPLYCNVEEPPKCTSFELPVYGWHGASVEAPSGELNPYRGKPQQWTRFQGHGEHLIPKFEQRYYANNSAFCKHLDSCGYMTTTTPDDGYMVLRLPKMKVGLISLCGFGKKAGDDIKNNPDLEIYFDGELLDRSTFDTYPSLKCARIMKRFPPHMTDANGHVYLALRLKQNADKTHQAVKISQIITL